MPTRRGNLPRCGVELTCDWCRSRREAGETVVCPYDGLAFADLRAEHDQIYFGRWRRMDATPIDIQRAYHQLGKHLRAIARALEKEDLPAARRDLERAREAYAAGDPREGNRDDLRYLDHALSYAHRVVDDLLHEKGLPPHAPMDFAEWYDEVEVPFRDEW